MKPEPKVIEFKHKRTPRDVKRYMSYWPGHNRDEVASELFNGTVYGCGDVGGAVTVIRLFDGEEIHVLVSNGDQSGAWTALMVNLKVDDAEIVVKTIGGDAPELRLLQALPTEVREVIAEWYHGGRKEKVH